MSGNHAFIDYLHELLDPLGSITTKKMFGGYGVYCNGIIMALVIDESLYLKVDEETGNLFTAAGCKPFVYHTRLKQVSMSYWSAPDETMESSEQMLPWARLAYAAALRKVAEKPVKRKTKKP